MAIFLPNKVLLKFTGILILLITISKCDPKCMIDQCKDCHYTNVYTCNTCEPGYYLRNYYGEEKGRTYQDCWSKAKLLWGLLLLTLLPCCYCGCCYALYKYGMTKIKVKDNTPDVEYQDKRKMDKSNDDVVVNKSPQYSVQNQPINIESENKNPNVIPAPITKPVVPVQKGVTIQPNPVIVPQPQVMNTPISPIYSPQKGPSKSILKQQQPIYANGLPPKLKNGSVVKRLPPIRRTIQGGRNQPYHSDYNVSYYPEDDSEENSRRFNRSVVRESSPVTIIEKEPTLIIERSPTRKVTKNNQRIPRGRVIGSAPKRIVENKAPAEVSYFDENGHKYHAYRVY